MPAIAKNYLLPVIIFSQFAGTSLWFAGNAIIDQVSSSNNHASVTSIVQFGFIAGTLLFSFLTIADRFQSSRVFFVSACIAALANILIIPFSGSSFAITILRFITGFFLAGIYPVGMKIAADFFPAKLGKALGFLVGALVLGTSFPHFVRSQITGLNWQVVLVITSTLAVIGGVLILLAVSPLHKRLNTKKIEFGAVFRVFRSGSFRSAAFGYFGHMWELYAFWSILPALFFFHNTASKEPVNAYLWSFLVIATGAIGCVAGGLLSKKFGSKRVAFYSLFLSGLCCVVAPLLFKTGDVFFLLILLWGLTVTADSPQFSALVAKYADANHKGTALTIVTSIGFAITIISIQVLQEAFSSYHEKALWTLAPGPLFGLIALKRPT